MLAKTLYVTVKECHLLASMPCTLQLNYKKLEFRTYYTLVLVLPMSSYGEIIAAFWMT